jgi:uncharacterized SAM-binding protein YcdF (DUF218 family)
MFFGLSKIVWFVLAPSHLLVLLAVVTLIILCRSDVSVKWRKRAQRMGWGLVIILAMLLTLPVGDWAIFPLEAKAPPAMKLPKHIDGMVILGAALDENITKYHGVVAINGKAERVIYPIPLAKRYPKAKIIYAGGSPQGHKQREADLARMFYQMLQIDTRNFTFERESRNTYENIINSKTIAEPKLNENWLLITSAFHMKRAMAVARHAGWEMIPYPVDYISGGWVGLGAGSLRYNLERLDAAFKEYVGLMAYRLFDKA